MTATDIPDSKRSGLPVDLDRLTADGDDWLSPGKRTRSRHTAYARRRSRTSS